MKILLLGSGGGYDIFAGFFLWKDLREQGHEVHLANHSFTDGLADIPEVKSIGSFTFEITAETRTTSRNNSYFPELHLAKHLQLPVYAIRRVSPTYLYQGIRDLVRHLQVERIICVDAGFDAFLLGDEGPQVLKASPLEDLATLVVMKQLIDESLIVDAQLMCVSVPTENLPLSMFWKNVSRMIVTGGVLEIKCVTTKYANEFSALLEDIPAEVRSVPNECIRAALHGHCDTEHYVNPRLTARISIEETAAFPPVTALTLMQFFFRFEVLYEQSIVLQELFKFCTFKSDESLADNQQQLIDADIAYHHWINDWFSTDAFA